MSHAFPLTELRRAFDETPWHGYLVAEGTAVLLLHLVSDRFDLDGYCAFRREHVTVTSEDFSRRDLLERALRLKSQSPVAPPNIAVDSLPECVATAQANYGIVVLDREIAAPGEVQVGAVRMNTADTYVLKWMSVDGRWENDSRAFAYRDITRVEFGREYEQTLLQVAEERGAEG